MVYVHRICQELFVNTTNWSYDKKSVLTQFKFWQALRIKELTTKQDIGQCQ